MRNIIYTLPEQIRDMLGAVPQVQVGKRFKNVLVCGMGGSGISGEILQALFPTVPIVINKDYSTPGYVSHETLAILISYSGNTEETLHNYKLLVKQKAGIVTISSGGHLASYKCLLQIHVPKGLPPRGALGYLFTPLPLILHRFHCVKNNPRKHLRALATFLMRKRDRIEKKAQVISRKCINRVPIIYANSQLFAPVAHRWQCQFNENAKIFAHSNIIPEMNHNEIVGLGRPRVLNKNSVLVFLNDPEADSRNVLRVKILKEIIENTFSDVMDIKPEGINNLEHVFWTIMLGDFISYYVATRTMIDPTPVVRIEYLKKRLSKL